MAEIFVSYSRKNKEFVRKLVDRIESIQRTVWVDWDSIPWTADWWQEIQNGIQSADNFVLVLSPASLSSVVCTLEISFAIENHKRIIPIVLEEADPQTAQTELAQAELDDTALRLLNGQDLVEMSRVNWRYLARHNWMFFNDEGVFDQSFANLLEAIDTDLEHLHSHTRILVRAKEWQTNRQDVSFLLQGTDLRSAERWLSDSGQKDPSPTQLQTQYIFASRERANLFARRLLTGVSIALVITLILVILSVFLWQQASFERDRADQAAQISESGRVALQGLLQLGNGRLDRSLLLGVQALSIDSTQEALNSLLTSLQASPRLLHFLYGHADNEIRAVGYKPDGSQFVTGDDSGRLVIWDVETLALSESYVIAEGGIWDLSFSPDGDMLAIASENGVVTLLDTDTYAQIGNPMNMSESAIFTVDFSPDGSLLAAGHSDSRVTLWDVSTAELVGSLAGHEDQVTALAWHPDGSVLVSGGRDTNIIVWDVANPQQGVQLGVLQGHSNWVWSLAFNRDGSLLASGSADTTVRLWDVQTLSPVGRVLTEHTDWVRGLKFSPDGMLLVSAAQDGTIVLREAETGRRLRDVAPIRGHPGDIFDLAFSPDSHHLVSVDRESNVLYWDLNRRQPFTTSLVQMEAEVQSIAYNLAGKRILIASTAGYVAQWDVDAGQFALEPSVVDFQVTAADFAPDGNAYVYGGTSGEIVFVEESGDVRFRTSAHDGLVQDLDFSRDGRLFATSGDDGVVAVHDSASGDLVGKFESPEGTLILRVVFSPDGERLYAGDDLGQISVWEVATMTYQRMLPTEHTGEIMDLVFNHAGDLLASASRDGTILLWDVESETRTGLPLIGHSNWVLGVSFSPDDRLLVSGSRDETIILWDIATQQAVGQPFPAYHGWVWGVEFSPDGESVITGSRDGNLSIWDMRLSTWIEEACKVANRPLSDLEIELFLGGDNNDAPCLEFIGGTNG